MVRAAFLHKYWRLRLDGLRAKAGEVRCRGAQNVSLQDSRGNSGSVFFVSHILCLVLTATLLNVSLLKLRVKEEESPFRWKRPLPPPRMRPIFSSGSKGDSAAGALTRGEPLLYSRATLRCSAPAAEPNRESGENPELPRSGMQERTPRKSTGSAMNWEAEASRWPASPKTCREACRRDGMTCTRFRGEVGVLRAVGAPLHFLS